MTVTMNMLADALASEGIAAQDMRSPDGRAFDQVSAIREDCPFEPDSNREGSDDERTRRDAQGEESRTLFVGSATACDALRSQRPDALCLAVDGERIGDACLVASALVADQLRWRLGIASLDPDEMTFQDVIDASERLTGNPLILSDAAFKIVAYSRNAIPDVPFVKEAIERGAFDNETMQMFRRRRRPAMWNSSEDIGVLDAANEERPYPVVNHVFRVNGHYYMHLVMHCSNYPLSDGLQDIFSMLIGVIEGLINRTSSAAAIFGQGAPRALADAALGKAPLTLKKADRDLLAAVGFAEGVDLRMVVCDLGYGEDDHELPGFAAFRLGRHFPDAFVLVCGTRVAMLFAARSLGESACTRDALAARMREAMEDQGVVCGISDAFSTLADIRFAFLEAEAAIASCEPKGSQRAASACGALVDKSAHGPNGAPVAVQTMTFHDAFVHYALSPSRDEALMEWCLAKSIPAILSREDDGPSGDFALLGCFLENERRATMVAEKVHMHRTSLLYRIGRIEHRFSIDLDDVSTRQRIMVEYALIAGFDKHGER